MKALRIATALLLLLAIIITLINLIPPRKSVENNPFIVGERELPMLAAHRGGGDNNPENTMLAFREAVYTYKVDIIESDLYLTADGYLVYNHDGYIDRTCNVNGDISYEDMRELISDHENRHYIEDMTLEQLRQYNFGYYFEDKEGNRIYKDAEDPGELGIQIATVEELFEEFYVSHPDLLFIVEIKNEGEAGYLATEKLLSVLDSYPEYRDNIVIGSFHGEIEENLRVNYPEVMRGASVEGAAKFIITQMLGINPLVKSDFACLQIPLSYDVGIEIDLERRNLIRAAHRKNIAVQYWTINDEWDMRRLIELGCDCIMTDDPALLRNVLSEYEAKK